MDNYKWLEATCGGCGHSVELKLKGQEDHVTIGKIVLTMVAHVRGAHNHKETILLEMYTTCSEEIVITGNAGTRRCVLRLGHTAPHRIDI